MNSVRAQPNSTPPASVDAANTAMVLRLLRRSRKYSCATATPIAIASSTPKTKYTVVLDSLAARYVSTGTGSGSGP